MSQGTSVQPDLKMLPSLFDAEVPKHQRHCLIVDQVVPQNQRYHLIVRWYSSTRDTT